MAINGRDPEEQDQERKSQEAYDFERCYDLEGKTQNHLKEKKRSKNLAVTLTR